MSERALRWLFVWCVALVGVLSPRPASAVDDPDLDYYTITTEHFHVHYFTGLDELARKVAVASEEAHEILTPIFDWEPAERTHVLVTDKLDSANGYAQVFGRNLFAVFGMPPESDSVLGFYDDWIRILVYHEYVHVLHLDTTHGLPDAINTVIGKQWNPNQILPRWIIEGIAVYHESARTGTGRVQSSLYSMWLRAEMLGAREPFTLGQVSNSPRRWPFGSTAYLMGSFFIDYLARRFGESAITKFSHIYGGRWVPYSMNHAFMEVTGESFDTMWPAFMAEAMAKARARQVAVEAAGRTPLEMVTTRGGESKFPRVDPVTGDVAFYHADFEEHPTYSIAGDDGPVDLFEVDGAYGAGEWSPDGEHFFYTRTTVEENVYSYQDVFRWTRASGRIQRLTKRERAREPAVSPDGRSIAYVRNRAGTMELVVRELRDAGPAGPARVLVGGTKWRWDDARHWQQVATPAWSPDGRSLVFSWWREDLRERDVWLYSLDAPYGERLRALTRDAAMDLDPSFGPDGTLYFASDRTGVYNVYAMDVERGEVWQVSNVLFGVFSPRLSKDGRHIYVTTYTQRGYDVARLEVDRASWRRAEPARMGTDWRSYPRIDTSGWTDSKYAPARWLAPLTFIPDIALISSGLGFAGTIDGYDPVGRHYYSLTAGGFMGDLGDIRPLASLSYRWGGWPVNVSASASFRQYTRARGLFAGSDFVPFPEQQVVGSLALSYPLRTIDDALSISLSYRVENRRYGIEPVVDFEPGDLEPFGPEHGWFNEMSIALSYDDLERFPYSVTTERGLSADLSFSLQDPAIGSDFQSLRVNYNLLFYWPVPWLAGHVLRLAGSGGFIDNDYRVRPTFTIGGLSQQNVIQALTFLAPTGGSRVRGYSPGAQRGNQFLIGGLEYRLPVLDLERGFSTAPLFFRQIKARGFVDAGTAYSGYLADANLLVGVGAELQLELVMGYYQFGDLRLGYARGLDPELGKHDLYVLYGGGF